MESEQIHLRNQKIALENANANTQTAFKKGTLTVDGTIPSVTFQFYRSGYYRVTAVRVVLSDSPTHEYTHTRTSGHGF